MAGTEVVVSNPVCGSCPWNRRATLGYWDPAHLIGIAYACSAVIPIGTMGCHQWNGHYSPNWTPTNASICGGWIRVTPEAGAVRLGIAKGMLDERDCADRAGCDLYPDPAAMLRWNGINPAHLPPLTPPEGGADAVSAWTASLIRLAGQMKVEPRLAFAYVIRFSPAHYGVNDDGTSKMPERKAAAWRRSCEKWEAARGVG